MTLKIALVGCGKVADQHVSQIQALPNASVVAVCDCEPLMAAQLALRFGIPRHYQDFGQMLAETKPDVVHVTTPPQSHLPLAIQAVSEGCHVLVEKPLAPAFLDAQELVRCVERGNRKLTIAYTYHFDPAMERLRQAIARGALGDIVHVESFLGYDLSGPYGRAVIEDQQHWVRRLPGGLLHNVADHLLNKVSEFIHDQDPELTVLAWEKSCSLGMPDELRVLIRGRDVSAYATFSANAKPLMHRLTVLGTKKTAHVDFSCSTVTFEPSSILPGVFGRISCSFNPALQHFRQATGNLRRFTGSKYHYLYGLRMLISAFYESIRCGGPVPISYSEILRNTKLLDAVVTRAYGEQYQHL